MHKNVFVDGHKQPDVMENQNCFLIKIKELKLYIIKFNKNGVIKVKDYPVDYAVRGEKCCSIIVITHDKCIFFTNNGVRKIWIWERDIFLQPKKQG